jgi:bidirectional [NiFe] hydrogenase diaphorase subunit
MYITSQKVAPPSDDKRWRIVNATMRRYGYEPDALIETLHSVQEAFGSLNDEALRFVAQRLRLPLSKVYGVATFYNHFTLNPQGEHSCVVCLGTACYIKGTPKVLEAVQQDLHVKPGGTTSDKQVSLLVARCVGMCWLAPVAVMDNEVMSEVTPEKALNKVREWTDHVSS